jgi:HK97 family phage major capsid protein
MTIQEIDVRLSQIADELEKMVKAGLDDETRSKFDTLEGEAVTLREDRKRLERAAELRNTPSVPVVNPETDHIEMGDAAEDRRFESFGEMAQAVYRAGLPGATVDPRLVGMNHRAANGLNEAVPADGGFLVEQELVGGLADIVWEDPVISRCMEIEVGPNANGVRMNGVDETSRANGYRHGGIRGYWRAEAGTVTATKPAFKRWQCDLESLMAICYATDEQLEDASQLNSWLPSAMAAELAFVLGAAIIEGDGAGKPLGIKNSGALVTVSKESGQAADTIVYENVQKMWARMPARSRANAVWLINQDCEPQLNGMTLDAGTAGYPVYLPPGGVSAAPYGSLLGRPVLPCEFCSTVGDTGDIQLVDLSQYALARKGGVKQATSIHLQFLYAETAFRAMMRVNGQSTWNSAVTPYKGSNTLSPFIWLQAR